jgi:TPR repeat protein
MVNKFGKSHLADLPTIEHGSHQEKVYNEMFKAIELLGRKLERSESERERLARRLSLIESATAVDENTGRLYLPATINGGAPETFTGAKTPRWALAMSVCSVLVALSSLYVSFYQSGPALTPQQVAALETIAATQLASLDSSKWQTIETPAASAESADPLSDTAPLLPPGSGIDVENAAEVEGLNNNIDIASAAEKMADIEPALGDTTATSTIEAPATGDLSQVFIPGEDEEPQTEKQAAVNVEKPSAPATASAEERMANANKREVERAGSSALFSRIAPDDTLPPDLALLEKRAAEDIPEAQHDLATLYAAGKVVPQDFKRAVYWFSRAADGGIANAHYNLGVMFQQGLGVRKDVKKALGWYNSAAELGHPEAMYNLGIAYVEGVGIKRDIEKGATYFKRAANAGVSQAAYNMGVLYESNFLGATDYDQALEWYKTAKKEGHAEAQAAITRVEKQAGSTAAALNNR